MRLRAEMSSARKSSPWRRRWILDISAWPIPGLVVFEGEGISENIRSYLYSTGKAVEFDDLEGWMRLFFRLP